MQPAFPYFLNYCKRAKFSVVAQEIKGTYS